MVKISEMAPLAGAQPSDRLEASRGGTTSGSLTVAQVVALAATDLAGRPFGFSHVNQNPQNGDVDIFFSLPVAGVLGSVDFDIGSGSLDLTVKKNGVAVTGLSSVNVAGAGSQASTGNNDFAAGDDLSVTISNASTPGAPSNLRMSFKFVYA